MSEFLTLYFIFIVATSITSCWFLFWPRLQEAKTENISNPLVDNPGLSCLVYCCIAAIFAPVLFFILIIPSASESYMQGLDKIIKEEKS